MRKTRIFVTLTFVVTFTLGSRSRNIVYMLSGYEMHLSTKYEVNPLNGLGGVREHARRHTRIQRTFRY